MAPVPMLQSTFYILLVWVHLRGGGGNQVSHLESYGQHLRTATFDDPFHEERRMVEDNRVRGFQPIAATAPTSGQRKSIWKGSGEAFPASNTVCEGEDAIFQLLDAPGSLLNCVAITNDGVFVQLYPPPNKTDAKGIGNSSIVFFDSGTDGQRCGFRLRGAKLSDYGRWRLTANTTKANVTADIGVSVKECPKSGSVSYYAFLPGEASASHCGPQGSSACYVAGPGDSGDSTPPGEAQINRCSTPDINFSNLVVGEWTCSWVWKGSMLQRTSRTDMTYRRLPDDQDVGLEWRNGSSSLGGRPPSLDLRCNYDGPLIVSLCRFVQPGGAVLYPKDGLAFGRYSYFGRGLSPGDCGLRVEQPLLPEDIGLWRCELVLATSKPLEIRGGFIEVGIASRTREDKLKTLRPWRPRNGSRSEDGGEQDVMEVVYGDPLIIGCSADAPLTLCLIRRPDGNASAPPEDASTDSPVQKYGRGIRLGDCGVRLRAANSSHTGRWECVVGIDYGDAHAVPIQVLVHENPLAVEVKGEVSRGEPVKFVCRSVLGVSLDSCRFERPDHTIVTVMDSRHQYAQRATWNHGVRAVGDLKAGFCEVNIPSVRDEDVGQWTCVAKAEDSKRDLHIRFHVEERGISIASVGAISGIIMAVVAVAAVGGAVGYRRRLCRWNTPNSTNQGVAGDDSVISFRRDDEEDVGSQAS